MSTVENPVKGPEGPATPTTQNGGKDAEDDCGYYQDDDVSHGNFKVPETNVSLTEVKLETGEENETVIWKHRAKLYRWYAADNAVKGSVSEWKERGLGDAKLLQHKQTKMIRFLLRQEKTMKIVANHYVVQKDCLCTLAPNVASDKILVWTVKDFAEEDKGKLEKFGLRFAFLEQTELFKKEFESAAKINGKLLEADGGVDTPADDSANADEKKSVTEKETKEEGATTNGETTKKEKDEAAAAEGGESTS